MQDIKETKRERVSNRKHKEFVSRFDTLALHPRRRHTKDFYYARSQWISPLCRNTYKPSDSLVPYTTQAHRLVEAAPQTPRVHNRTRNHQVLTRTRNNHGHTRPPSQETKMNFGDHNSWSPKILSQKHSYRMNMSMGCSSVCEKNKEEKGGGKLKESL